MDRRQFIGAAGGALALSGRGLSEAKPVRLGVIGTGGRGTNLLQISLDLGGVEVPALCDINKEHLARAQDLAETRLRKKPEGYSGEDAYKKLLERDDVDAVIIATPWEWHTRMGVQAMKAGKYTAIEVPAALTVEECWQLVDTHEQTGTQCMMLENWSFRQDNLAVLKMIRQGMLGEIIHCHCAHSHNCVYWYFDEKGEPRWSGKYLLSRNADPYPTHALGPVLSWMDWNCGDYPRQITSAGTRSISIPRYFAAKLGPQSEAATRKYAQSDIVTSVVKTHRGNTLVINNDMQTPRPYDNRWEVSGTNGVYNEQRASIFLTSLAEREFEENWTQFAPFQEKYDHKWYREFEHSGDLLHNRDAHGGPDYIEIQQFLRAARDKKPTPIDIYDSVLMSVVIPLSAVSLARDSAPVQFPDFTRGKWKTRRPYFAVES